MNSTINNTETNIEELIVNTLNKALLSTKHAFVKNEWMTLKDAAKYADVSYNTFMKFREMGLKVCEIDGVKRVSRKEIDKFLESYSY
ncbi:helix-turn-helix domain-containing protein [Sporosarcina sp. resist]|uniref:helix-turn-helix domain-containing protein n=1 Tax=Sporosarcina sp. resist TaxID=2762563 RepID=UPI00164D8798|nr:helix-turn-helix domain-containing protein [Sporosarcina sp. resist]QNK88917.1 helix-turn-helix domain-containing protein [Sporosarcina sp. resist]